MCFIRANREDKKNRSRASESPANHGAEHSAAAVKPSLEPGEAFGQVRGRSGLHWPRRTRANEHQRRYADTLSPCIGCENVGDHGRSGIKRRNFAGMIIELSLVCRSEEH